MKIEHEPTVDPNKPRMREVKMCMLTIFIPLILFCASCNWLTSYEQYEHHKNSEVPKLRCLIDRLKGQYWIQNGASNKSVFHLFESERPIREGVWDICGYLVLLISKNNTENCNEWYIVAIPIDRGLLMPDSYVMNNQYKVFASTDGELYQKMPLTYDSVNRLNFSKQRILWQPNISKVIETEGREVTDKIEAFRQKMRHLPNSLTEIGIEETPTKRKKDRLSWAGGFSYEKVSDGRYMVTYTLWDEPPMVYDSDKKVWKEGHKN